MDVKVNSTTYSLEDIWDRVTVTRIRMEMIRGYLSGIYRYEALCKNNYVFDKNPLHTVVRKNSQGREVVYILDERRMVDSFFSKYAETIQEFNYILTMPLTDDDLKGLIIDTMNELRTLRDDYERSKKYIQNKWKGWNCDEETADTRSKDDRNHGDNGSNS